MQNEAAVRAALRRGGHSAVSPQKGLVVTGSERGHICLDDRANKQGRMPRESSGARVTFAHWYLDWLAAAKREVQARTA